MTFELSTTWTMILVGVLVWDLAWKGLALWRAARLGHCYWFVVLLAVNSVGILPIIYLLTHDKTTPAGRKQS
jgi:hypothetical protein